MPKNGIIIKIIAGGFSFGLNKYGNITNKQKLIEGYDYYDVASYLASRGYSNNSNINLTENDISNEIAKYLESIQNNRLQNTILDGLNLNNYNINCNAN